MPTAGTHITLIELLAKQPEFTVLLGDPVADETEEDGKRMRYAKLGAIGPDIFYALMDYGGQLQDLTNFLSKIAGTFSCIEKLTKTIDKFTYTAESDITLGLSDEVKARIADIKKINGYIGSFVITELIKVTIDEGYNFWPVFEARRQQDAPREKWFWADYLHYVNTGEFVKNLFVNSGNNPYQRAFAFGYLSHYVTDVVGHPFINMVVGSTWRMYWQRHHLVENFVDAYVWDRWHDSAPTPPEGDPEEQGLDRIRDWNAPHQNIGDGAPYTFARINDHIDIGGPVASDPVSDLIKDICEKLEQGLEDLGIAEPDLVPPGNPDFLDWTKMMAATFRSTYSAADHPPENLKTGGRPDGYPTAEDIAGAYSVLRLYFRCTTENTIREPVRPDVRADVLVAMEKVLDDLANNLKAITPPPTALPGPLGSANLEDIWLSVMAWVKWSASTAVALTDAALDFARDQIALALLPGDEAIKIGMYYACKGLFDLYTSVRIFLVRAGYAVPYTDELGAMVGSDVNAESLWTVPRERPGPFPLEELPDIERARIQSSYPPWAPLDQLPEMREPNTKYTELPETWAGPYPGGSRPEAFLVRPAGGRAMLSPSGPMPFGEPKSLQPPPVNFGGALANCEIAFRAVLAAERTGHVLDFPNYNLDGDRGYAWPCWDVDPPPTTGGSDPEPLDPTKSRLVPPLPLTVKPKLILPGVP